MGEEPGQNRRYFLEHLRLRRSTCASIFAWKCLWVNHSNGFFLVRRPNGNIYRFNIKENETGVTSGPLKPTFVKPHTGSPGFSRCSTLRPNLVPNYHTRQPTNLKNVRFAPKVIIRWHLWHCWTGVEKCSGDNATLSTNANGFFQKEILQMQ